MFLDIASGQVNEGLLNPTLIQSAESDMKAPTKRPLARHDADQRFRELWHDETVQLRAICVEFNASYKTIIRRAQSLGLPMDRPGRRYGKGTRKAAKLKKRTKQITEWRRKWLAYCGANPNMGRSDLRYGNQALYSALYSHDRQWLQGHFPDMKVRATRRSAWKEQDAKVLRKLKAEHKAILGNQSFPERITTNAFARYLPEEKFYNYRLRRLPLSRRFLKAVTESRFEFTKRCLVFAATQFRDQGVRCTSSELVERAKVSLQMAMNSRVRALIARLSGL